jgi:hypothetical protein
MDTVLVEALHKGNQVGDLSYAVEEDMVDLASLDMDAYRLAGDSYAQGVVEEA